MRNYIFAGKVNFEGSSNDGRTEGLTGKKGRGKGEEEKGRKRGRTGRRIEQERRIIKEEERNMVPCKGALGVEEEEVGRWVGGERRRGERDGGRKQKEGRQLLKAIALPPGCLRRAESVEMLNLA